MSFHFKLGPNSRISYTNAGLCRWLCCSLVIPQEQSEGYTCDTAGVKFMSGDRVDGNSGAVLT